MKEKIQISCVLVLFFKKPGNYPDLFWLANRCHLLCPRGQLEARLDSKGTHELTEKKSSNFFANEAKESVNLASSKMEGTLVGDSKFLQADFEGTMGATWRTGVEDGGDNKFPLTTGLMENQVLHERNSSSLGSTSRLLESLPEKNDEDTTDPLRILEGAVNAIREARHEDASLASSAILTARTGQNGVAGQVMKDLEDDVDSLLGQGVQGSSATSGWGNVLRHFGAETEDGEAEAKALRRQSACHHLGEGMPAGYPQKLERLDQTEKSMVSGGGVQDSLDLLQDLQNFRGTNASAASISSNTLGHLNTLQRPIVKDDFAALAAATPEDFDAFLARLKGQEPTSRGRSPLSSGMNVKDLDMILVLEDGCFGVYQKHLLIHNESMDLFQSKINPLDGYFGGVS